MPSLPSADLNLPVIERLQQDFPRLHVGQTVGEALAWVRQNPPAGRVIYFYVVDAAEHLVGIVPTRRLILSPPETPLTDIMTRKVVALLARATVQEACEFFLLHRFLALPVVAEDRRLLGVVDIELYTDELTQLDWATPVGRLVAPLARFLHIESSSGLVLLACTALALILANSPAAAAVADFWHTQWGLKLGAWSLIMPLEMWVNDGLMCLFFFVVGLEIKRELVVGELADWRKALLPVVAAVGGMVVPALLYLLGEAGSPAAHGWGIPMATDIAFAVGFLTLFGPRVPGGVKILLLTLAIVDDIGAILVIAVAYSTGLAWLALALAFLGLALILLLQRLGVRSTGVYVVLGIAIWLAFLKSGVHPTVAGVLLGLLTPARPAIGRRLVLDVVSDLYARLRGGPRGGGRPYAEAVSPLERLEMQLHPWVAFVIMPVFALANAGVKVELGALGASIALAVTAGLVLGKPLGIVLFSWAAVKSGLARLPAGVTWKIMVGTGCLGGIGFTMALFIAHLAFDAPFLDEAKVGVLVGSAASAALGCLLLMMFLPRGAAAVNQEEDEESGVGRPLHVRGETAG